MNKSLLWLLFLWVAFVISCSHKSASVAEPDIDTQIVLSIGKVNITAYELDKNLKASKPQFMQQTFNSSSSQLFNRRKEEFINKTYFLADAYDKGYHKNTHIDSMVDGAARFMVSQPNGLLELEINKQYKIDGNELNKAIERSTKEFHIEYLKFKDKNSALKNMHGITVNTSSGFNALLNKVDLLEVTYKEDVLTWPFRGYWGKEEEILNLNRNDISSLLRLHDGYYLIHVKDINELHRPVLTADEMKIRMEEAKRQETRDMLVAKILGRARPNIADKTVAIFTGKLKNYKYGPNHTFLKTDFRDILGTTMLTYLSPSGRIKIITVNNFIDFYNTLFIKKGIKSTDDVVRNLNAICFSDYAYAESVNKGITTQPKFLLDRNNFKNNLIYNKYTEQELADKNAISKNEILQMYHLMIPNLTQAETVVASIYYFNNQSEAIRKKFNVRSDTLTFKGLTKADRHLTFNYKSKELPGKLKRSVFDMNLKNNSARMIELNNQYIVVVKEKETGTRVRNLAEVRDLVVAEIKNRRLLKNEKARLAILKTKYKPKIDLTDSF